MAELEGEASLQEVGHDYFFKLVRHQQDLGLGRFWRLFVRGLRRRRHIQFLLIAEQESVPRLY